MRYILCNNIIQTKQETYVKESRKVRSINEMNNGRYNIENNNIDSLKSKHNRDEKNVYDKNVTP